MKIQFLTDKLFFPPVEDASPEGILAIGGDLSVERLLLAYRSGIFPWYNPEDPIIWWSPEPRFVLFPNEVYISKSMSKLLKKNSFNFTIDKAFKEVITNCSNFRVEGTWITDEMINAYFNLHLEGYAHSIEVWLNNKLVGGLYGVSQGKIFYGESMFSTESNASKAALIVLSKLLQKLNFLIIDSQVHNNHMESMGAINIPRQEYLKINSEALKYETIKGSWSKFLSNLKI